MVLIKNLLVSLLAFLNSEFFENSYKYEEHVYVRLPHILLKITFHKPYTTIGTKEAFLEKNRETATVKRLL